MVPATVTVITVDTPAGQVVGLGLTVPPAVAALAEEPDGIVTINVPAWVVVMVLAPRAKVAGAPVAIPVPFDIVPPKSVLCWAILLPFCRFAIMLIKALQYF
jgi:hypothetical protein